MRRLKLVNTVYYIGIAQWGLQPPTGSTFSSLYTLIEQSFTRQFLQYSAVNKASYLKQKLGTRFNKTFQGAWLQTS